MPAACRRTRAFEALEQDVILEPLRPMRMDRFIAGLRRRLVGSNVREVKILWPTWCVTWCLPSRKWIDSGAPVPGASSQSSKGLILELQQALGVEHPSKPRLSPSDGMEAGACQMNASTWWAHQALELPRSLWQQGVARGSLKCGKFVHGIVVNKAYGD